MVWTNFASKPWQTPGIAGPGTPPIGRKPRTPFGNGIQEPEYQKRKLGWGDALAMVGGAMMDMDGTMGSGNLANAKAELEYREQQNRADFEQKQAKRLRDLAAGGDKQALFMLDPSLAISQQNADRNFYYKRQRDQITDARQTTLDAQSALEHDLRIKGLEMNMQPYRWATPEELAQAGLKGGSAQVGADGRLIAVKEPPAPVAAPDPLDYRPVALGEGMYSTYNPETRRWEVGSAAPDMGFDVTTGGPAPRDYQSPFRDLGMYDEDGQLQPIPTLLWQGGETGGANIEDRRIGLGPSPSRSDATRYDKKLDETAAKDIAAWKTGGRTRAFTSLQKLNDIIVQMEQNPNLTGPVVGNMPAGVRAFTNPQSIAAQQQVESVIQDSLKAILGGQYTENEGKAVLARSYNPTLQEEYNLKTLRTLYNDLVGRAYTMDAMSQYGDQTGSLQGFRSPMEDVTDFRKTPTGMQIPQGAISALRNDPSLAQQFDLKYGDGAAAQYLGPLAGPR